ncbi:2Fe-2S iron-sulfur cluster-binding protein [Thiolinea disciformis]|uniref:2Fe-2S iron-sulfur cluster-binding protein n=1 Tax=Thiolinea disciformis TaxID=125614 RepID=UPI00037F1A58|nr:2Fe-2S iron-sulfur cluster-binding protein [Thiolinea disciformis]
MTYTVIIRNTNYQFIVEAQESILQAALRQNIPLPWGCGAGLCGMCLGQIIQGQVEYTNGMPLALFEEDEQAGRGLFCCAYARSDLIIDHAEINKS